MLESERIRKAGFAQKSARHRAKGLGHGVRKIIGENHSFPNTYNWGKIQQGVLPTHQDQCQIIVERKKECNLRETISQRNSVNGASTPKHIELDYP